jgi:hypothetical protein
VVSFVRPVKDCRYGEDLFHDIRKQAFGKLLDGIAVRDSGTAICDGHGIRWSPRLLGVETKCLRGTLRPIG